MGQSQSSSTSTNPGRRRNDYYTHTQTPPPRPPPAQIPSSSYYPTNSYYQPPTQNPPRYFAPYNPNPYYQPYQYNWAPAPPVPVPVTAVPPPFVESQSTKTVKNDVNLHKQTIQLVPDEQNPDQHLVSFVFDASVDGSMTIYYFAKEGPNFTFVPTNPEIHTPTTIPFQKGTAQKFIQPNKSGIDLNFFSHDELSNPSNDGTFPLVIYADATPQNKPSKDSIHAQVTLAVIERNKNNEGGFLVKVVKQILWIEGERYELQEIFGLVGESQEENEVKDFEEEDLGKECVVCLSEPRDTAVLPCRHMCLCSECAKALRLQSNKCPICRQPIEQLIEIKVHNAEK
ncbi:hypothetical protein LUZ60_003719 [Juncus effusus]|nr:hypothetical protein LUZ60_003719 [Juncus effusus]